ncbi:unnamed protein product [Mesocestoides corti]|uniref:R3H domain-containing protein n=1 Tax=Mesocestoides corti TaxID=53468 RepID=A0A0R3UG87_MESCO|nr:unnamed protein product [Mesocestoides corti]
MVIHACNEVCGRMLSCGKHTCEDVCHCGPCGTCWRGVIYEELYCYCGATCLPPPQPCGSLPPECPEPCSREHPCDHPVQHTCHSELECPKCTVLMTKRCLGDHTWMFNVPCFQTVVTCGRPCDKPLPRCSHRCKRQCHAGPCLADASSEASGCTPLESACTQPCTAPRSGCGHPCGQPCHEASGITCSQALGKLKCQFMIPLVCACGHRQEEQPCYQVSILVAALKKKDPNFFLRSQNSQSSKLPFGLPSNDVLPCDSSCTRANQEAEAKATAPTMWVRGGAHVVDDSLPAPFPPPEYSDWLKQFALDNLSFAADVEKTLYELVEKAFEITKAGNKADFNKCISHRFVPMNRHKRRFIIELAEFYGIECVELDPGPHRHVQALTTAAKARFPGGGSKQHFVSLVGKMQSNFVGSVKFPEPAQSQIMKPAFLRSVQDDSSKNVSFSSVVGNKGLTDKSTWDD